VADARPIKSITPEEVQISPIFDFRGTSRRSNIELEWVLLGAGPIIARRANIVKDFIAVAFRKGVELVLIVADVRVAGASGLCASWVIIHPEVEVASVVGSILLGQGSRVDRRIGADSTRADMM